MSKVLRPMSFYMLIPYLIDQLPAALVYLRYPARGMAELLYTNAREGASCILQAV